VTSGDRIFGLVMIVVALGYLLSATQIQTSFMSDPVGPRLFPYLIGGVTMTCALSMVLRPDPDADWPGLGMAAKLAFACVVMFGYAAVIRPWGFILPTVVAAGVLSWLISPRPVPAALTGLGFGFGLFVLFKHVLGLGLVGWPRAWMG